MANKDFILQRIRIFAGLENDERITGSVNKWSWNTRVDFEISRNGL